MVTRREGRKSLGEVAISPVGLVDTSRGNKMKEWGVRLAPIFVVAATCFGGKAMAPPPQPPTQEGEGGKEKGGS